jgi:hypothetical protein
VERLLDHDLSRFEMVQLPAAAFSDEEDEARAARLEEENLTLRDRLFLMERDMAGGEEGEGVGDGDASRDFFGGDAGCRYLRMLLPFPVDRILIHRENAHICLLDTAINPSPRRRKRGTHDKNGKAED